MRRGICLAKAGSAARPASGALELSGPDVRSIWAASVGTGERASVPMDMGETSAHRGRFLPSTGRDPFLRRTANRPSASSTTHRVEAGDKSAKGVSAVLLSSARLRWGSTGMGARRLGASRRTSPLSSLQITQAPPNIIAYGGAGGVIAGFDALTVRLISGRLPSRRGWGSGPAAAQELLPRRSPGCWSDQQPF